MRASVYLGELGGLSRQAALVLLDHRGTGDSATPDDTGSYRCDRLVADVEALRGHLGLDTMNVLAHSAGANVAALYAARYPERVRRLVLVTPSVFAVGIPVPTDVRRELLPPRQGEPWYPAAAAAFEAIMAGEGTDEDWAAMAPLTYGRWDAAARAHHAADGEQRNAEAAAMFGAPGAFDPETTRAALRDLAAPVLFLAGEWDILAPPRVVAEYAELFQDATLVTLRGGGHFPWLDDPTWFTTVVASFLG